MLRQRDETLQQQLHLKLLIKGNRFRKTELINNTSVLSIKSATPATVIFLIKALTNLQVINL